MRFPRLFLILTCLMGCFLFVPLSFAQEPRFVRVAIEQDAQSFTLKIKGPYEVIDYLSKKVIYQGSGLNATVTLYKNNIMKRILCNLNCFCKCGERW